MQRSLVLTGVTKWSALNLRHLEPIMIKIGGFPLSSCQHFLRWEIKMIVDVFSGIKQVEILCKKLLFFQMQFLSLNILLIICFFSLRAQGFVHRITLTWTRKFDQAFFIKRKIKHFISLGQASAFVVV